MRVITGPLETGELAVVVYNRDKGDRKVRVEWGKMGWVEETMVRDLYEGRDLGRVEGGMEVEVKGNGVRVFRLTK